MQAILDGATIGASQGVEGENPAVIKGDQQREKEVQVAAGQVLVEMHVTNWVAAQKKTLNYMQFCNGWGLRRKLI